MRKYGRLRLRVTISLRDSCEGRSDKEASNNKGSSQPHKEVKVLLSLLRTSPMGFLCQAAVEAYQELTGFRASLQNYTPQVYINNRAQNLGDDIGGVCEQLSMVHVVLRGKKARERNSTTKQVSSTEEPQLIENESSPSVATIIQTQEEQSCLQPELAEVKLNQENERLLRIFTCIDRFLEGNRLLRNRPVETFEAIERNMNLNYFTILQAHHLHKLLWLVPDIYNVHVQSRVMYISIPIKQRGHANSSARLLKVRKALLRWTLKHGDEPIPQKQVLPDLHKLSAELQRNRAPATNQQELDPFSILRPQMKGGVFGERLLEIVRRKQQASAAKTTLFNI